MTARQLVLSIGYGAVAGAVTALTLALMHWVTALVWSVSPARWYIGVAIMAGGVLIAALQHLDRGESLANQLDDAREGKSLKFKSLAILAAVAIISVGFGGAVGPEAGILAIVAELSVLVSYLLAKDLADRQLIAQTGAAGSMGAIYGSPPGGAVMAQGDDQMPRVPLILAGLAGFGGFLLTAEFVLHGSGMRIDLPAHIPSGDGRDLFLAAGPALAGAATGVLFAKLLPMFQSLLGRMGPAWLQTLVCTAAFATMAMLVPMVRFSGHEQIDDLLAWGATAGAVALLGLAALKVTATATCLAAGWRGGAIFPLIMAGGAAGWAVAALFPAIPVTVALVAGMSAATTIGMGRPLAAALIALLLIGPASVGGLVCGVMIGWVVSRRFPTANVH